jgi:hypothetical protein
VVRYATRMLGGVHRPPPPNYLAIACRLFNQAIKIRKRLWPYMEEQRQLLERLNFERDVTAMLREVYGNAEGSNSTAPDRKVENR